MNFKFSIGAAQIHWKLRLKKKKFSLNNWRETMRRWTHGSHEKKKKKKNGICRDKENKIKSEIRRITKGTNLKFRDETCLTSASILRPLAVRLLCDQICKKKLNYKIPYTALSYTSRILKHNLTYKLIYIASIASEPEGNINDVTMNGANWNKFYYQLLKMAKVWDNLLLMGKQKEMPL